MSFVSAIMYWTLSNLGMTTQSVEDIAITSLQSELFINNYEEKESKTLLFTSDKDKPEILHDDVDYSTNYLLCPDFTEEVFVDGVFCCGKTRVLNHFKNSVNSDFCERVKENKDYITKSTNKFQQFLYSFEWFKLISDNKKCLFDRSPITDMFYHFIFNEPNTCLLEYHKNFMNIINTFPNWLFKTFNTIFIIPTISLNDKILSKAIARANGIDQLDIEYVNKQIMFFTLLKNKSQQIANSKFHFITTNELYTKSFLNKFIKVILTFSEENKHIVFANTEIDQMHDTDAGYDLSLKNDIHLKANHTYQLKLNEKICIPEGYYGTLHNKSSMMKYGIVTPGIIDANYNQDLSCFFTCHKDVILYKYRKICQIIFTKKSPVKIRKDNSKFKFISKRGKGFGSTGIYKITSEEMSSKWSAQPQTEEQEQERQRDQANLIDYISD